MSYPGELAHIYKYQCENAAYNPGRRWGKFKGGINMRLNRPNLAGGGLGKVVLVGYPNVGKSVVFNRLTGLYVLVSNYPGTTVEVARGRGKFKVLVLEVIDTPGLYSLLPSTVEEKVARRLLLEEKADVVVHVADACNIERMLPLTLQLLEAGMPLVLLVNMIDEAKRRGLKIRCDLLSQRLQIPVIPAIAISNWGLGKLRKKVAELVHTATA